MLNHKYTFLLLDIKSNLSKINSITIPKEKKPQKIKLLSTENGEIVCMHGENYFIVFKVDSKVKIKKMLRR